MNDSRPPRHSPHGKAPLPWTLPGYFPKRRLTRSRWVSPLPEHPEAPFPAPLPVEEICSVSECIARGPEPADRAGTNSLGGFESPAAAWRAVPEHLRSEFQLLAYRLRPVLFGNGTEDSRVNPLEVSLEAGASNYRKWLQPKLQDWRRGSESAN